MNIDLRLCSAIAEAVVEGATEQLLMLQDGSTPRKALSIRRSLTPDDQLSSTRLYYRKYFRDQTLRSPKSITPTPPSSRSPTPEQNAPKKSAKRGSVVAQLTREVNDNTIKQGRRNSTIKLVRQDGITKSRRSLQKYHRHSMITRTRSLSMPGFRLFDLEHPPSSEEIYR
ncbi:uncharacterized protein PV07_12545 [Cladophialophora immunda]|uniref:Uncharacterized protein n=1 Tax=Cladophialophora immunda TaxID=569365 RepID=A0A0D2BSQ2_9EURO|nr:uncharacterized protein PV07_12545 [Cladophialophora immunda]KIW22053.1 hypothetical protein PV07_12545 [Cladophialophora immunda]